MKLSFRFMLIEDKVFDMGLREEAEKMLDHVGLARPGLADLVCRSAATLKGIACRPEELQAVLAEIHAARPITPLTLVANIVFRGQLGEGLLDLRGPGAARLYVGRGATVEYLDAVVDAALGIEGDVLLTPDVGPVPISNSDDIARAAALVSGEDEGFAKRVIMAHQKLHPGFWRVWAPAAQITYVAGMLRRSAAVGERDAGRIAMFFS